MAGKASVRAFLTPQQFITIAQFRFDDATALSDTGRNARANGTMYIAGFVVECLLKARLLRRHEWLQRVREPGRLSKRERELWFLCHRSHDLIRLLEAVPDTFVDLQKYGSDPSGRLAADLRQVCALWTVHIRYDTRQATMTEARRFLDQVRELRQWLK
jgi:hypothetical protein